MEETSVGSKGRPVCFVEEQNVGRSVVRCETIKLLASGGGDGRLRSEMRFATVGLL